MKDCINNFYTLISVEDDLYKNCIIETLNNRTNEIADFFQIERLENPIVIKIYNSTDSFKEYILPYLYDGKYYDWMIGSTMMKI